LAEISGGVRADTLPRATAQFLATPCQRKVQYDILMLSTGAIISPTRCALGLP